nr:Chain B, COLLAGEN TRIPLE HELIX [synthetic construct]
PGPPGPP